ncbi:MAG: ABC transporter substrate-binding protein [Elusimicrobia bacterium]|nr:ABC transporter substrate-binding protein [Elusimicrobiota bacterium]
MSENKILKVGHSPDADDAFMFYALSKGVVTLDGFTIQHVIEDIQSLNQRALKSELEVTAISAAVYPLIQDRYWILSCGASVGRNYGPIVVAKQPHSLENLVGKRIAVPGVHTTAYLLLKLFLGKFDAVMADFKDVIPLVQSGAVDAGLVIHEGQLEFGSLGLQSCMDLGRIWHDRYGLPIPLGLDVVRKDLGLETATKIKRALYESICYARANEEKALDYALEFGRGMGRETARQFVGMYVNEDTLDLGPEGHEALVHLFRSGGESGVIEPVERVEII